MGEHVDFLNVSEGNGVSVVAELFKESMFLRTVFEQHRDKVTVESSKVVGLKFRTHFES
jgi:hypothetical protein